MQLKDEEFSKAFNADNGNEVSPDAPDAGATEGTAAAVVIDPATAVQDAAEDAGIDTSGAAAGEGAAADPAAVEEVVTEAAAEPEGEQLSPEDLQRQKSWEGRLRKREEELAARESAMGNGGGQSAPDDAEIAELKSRAAADFGEDFVEMISKIAAYEARKLVGADLDSKLSPINQTIEQAIRDVHEAFESMHFGAIEDAHENFREIIDSPEFAAYINGLSGDEQAAAQSVLDGGSPKQVIALLTAYKSSLEQKRDEAGPDESIDPALEAAEGVRGSAPISLPERTPVGAEDEYKSAWDAM